MRRVKTKQLVILIVLAITAMSILVYWPTTNYYYSQCIQSLYLTANGAAILSETDMGKVKTLSTNIGLHKTCANKCKISLNSNITLLVVVKSYIGNFDQRLEIRRTWGRQSENKFIVVFMVGKQDYAQRLFEIEENMYHDIVQGLFEDTYDNNIVKTLMTYKWIVDFCANVKYVLFLDDDCLLNTDYLLHAINVEMSFQSQSAMYGNKLIGILRRENRKAHKWYVSRNEYTCKFYPQYLTGAAILTHINIVKQFSIAFRYVKTIHIDDVYLGIVASSLDVPLINDNRFSNDYVAPNEMKGYFSSHKYGTRGSLDTGWKIFNYLRTKGNYVVEIKANNEVTKKLF